MPDRNTARALWHTNRGHSEIREQEIHSSGPASRHFTTLFSLLSSGTEGLVAKGEVLPTVADAMTVPGMEGGFSLPVKYGYSVCGYFTDRPGTYFHLMYPHQTACYIDPDLAVRIPSEIPPERATLASNMETAVNALWDGRPVLGENCLVMGYGLIGALTAHLLRHHSGVRLWIMERDRGRRQRALEKGFRLWTDEEQTFDLIYNTTGDAEAWNRVFPNTESESRLVELSWTGAAASRLELGSQFHTNRLCIIASQVSEVPSGMRSRWDHARRKDLVMDLLHHPALDELLTDRVAFEDLPELFERIRRGDAKGLGYLIVYE